MLDFREKEVKQLKRRGVLLAVVFTLLFVVFALRLLDVQVFKHEQYVQEASVSSRRVASIPATRGNILDRNGTPLVTNRAINTIVFDAVYFPGEDDRAKSNNIILSLIKLVESRGEVWKNDLPLVLDSKGIVQYRKLEDDVKYTTFLKSEHLLHLNDYATAENCLDNLVDMYKLETYSKADALKISAVYFGQRYDDFSANRPYTFASDVSPETIAIIHEQGSLYVGVDSRIKSAREYPDDTIAPHILGVVQPLSEEQLKENKDKGYAMDDVMGQDGIESAMEKYLRGTAGKESVVVSANGEVKRSTITEPENGNNVVLTIDKSLQIAAQNVLKQQVNGLLSSGYGNAAGSVVGLDLKTGEVLLSASEPTFTLTQRLKDYDAVLNARGKPLYNRALQGEYAPGSAYKPAVAVAGLESGVINTGTTVNCTRQYFRFSEFSCLEYNGSISIVNALEHSCNIFFYETGYQLGVSRMNHYSTLLGLGQKTGVEVPESTGRLANPEDFQIAHPERPWQDGDTVQAAIGQSDHLFTPIQLANYAATLGNGGTRYQPHFVKTIKSYDYSKTVLNNQPVVTQETGFSKANLATVTKGMSLVGSYTGSATYALLSNYSPKVAVKTGTAEVWDAKAGRMQLNVFLIVLAPYDNPQIALCIALEDAKNSLVTASVAVGVLNEFFGSSGSIETGQNAGMLLP